MVPSRGGITSARSPSTSGHANCSVVFQRDSSTLDTRAKRAGHSIVSPARARRAGWSRHRKRRRSRVGFAISPVEKAEPGELPAHDQRLPLRRAPQRHGPQLPMVGAFDAVDDLWYVVRDELVDSPVETGVVGRARSVLLQAQVRVAPEELVAGRLLTNAHDPASDRRRDVHPQPIALHPDNGRLVPLKTAPDAHHLCLAPSRRPGGLQQLSTGGCAVKLARPWLLRPPPGPVRLLVGPRLHTGSEDRRR